MSVHPSNIQAAQAWVSSYCVQPNYIIYNQVIYQTWVGVFHQEIQTLRSGLKNEAQLSILTL